MPLSLRRPRAVLVAGLVVIAVLAVLGLGVEGKLRPTSLSVPGTDSGKASELVHRYFGDTAPFAILLQGPPAELDRRAAHRSSCLDRLPLGQRERRESASQLAQGADLGRLPRQRRGGG
jgi:hypothetical protein